MRELRSYSSKSLGLIYSTYQNYGVHLSKQKKITTRSQQINQNKKSQKLGFDLLSLCVLNCFFLFFNDVFIVILFCFCFCFKWTPQFDVYCMRFRKYSKPNSETRKQRNLCDLQEAEFRNDQEPIYKNIGLIIRTYRNGGTQC